MMKKSIIVLGIVLFAVAGLILVAALILTPAFSGNVVKKAPEPILLTEDNFPSYIEGNVARNLPKDSKIALNVAGTDYGINGREVNSGGLADADINVVIPESYLNKEYNGVCDLLRDVVNNGDVSIDTSLSKAELLWKYRSLLKYRACFE